MKFIGAYEAKTHLPRLLDEVAAGGSYTITKHGRPVARLVAVAASKGSGEVAAGLRHARQGITLQGTTVRELAAEGRQ